MRMDSKDKRQTTKNNRLIQAMRHASAGVWSVLRHERNMRIHLVLGIIAIFLGIWLKIRIQEWLWIILAIFFVMISEFANTVAEALTDLIVKNNYDPIAKRIKDVSAGSVLMSAVFAVIIGAFIFIPKIF